MRIGVFVSIFAAILLMSSVALGGETDDKMIQMLNKGNIKAIRTMIEQGANVDTRSMDGWSKSPGGPSLLMLTACGEDCGIPLSPKEQLSFMKFLLAKGADVNALTSLGETALVYAVHGPHDIQKESATNGGEIRLPVVKLLIEHGANLNVKTQDGTPLTSAAEQGYYLVVEILLRNGARLGYSEAMKFASYQKHARTLQVLKQHPAKP